MATYDSRDSLARGRQRPSETPGWFIQLLALVILLLCVAIGVVGLILPIIPGLLFLALAALIAARMFPALARRLRKNPTFAVWLDSSDGFTRLSLRDKLRYVGWLTLRMLLDFIILLYKGLMSILMFARKSPPRR